jgi:hypothetical protein
MRMFKNLPLGAPGSRADNHWKLEIISSLYSMEFDYVRKSLEKRYLMQQSMVITKFAMASELRHYPWI